ncbi:sigma-70 family RNA polymerase sigma factor [Jeotgalibaca arthritidis]|uniref:Sigma-70 family RNA polymerase sigma factor n=1 Tax=Jeotgalibaca arthritidis TaxID=1868794 RepID=A0A6G7KBJ7_9LACT|nr:sigma-70 family RNA polymerase sigma factor [Jeotgalibaca arthritidis]QII82617.1 sigma-70 family RNA polymerase sigma factor [Jeotgalibaca arthritidis]
MFEWLTEYRKLEERISFIEWNLNKTKLELIRWEEGDLMNIKLTNESRGANVENEIKRLEEELEETERLKESLLNLIDTFEGLDNIIIKKKYIEGLSLEDIAEVVGYSTSYVRKRYTEIRKTLKIIDQYTEK